MSFLDTTLTAEAGYTNVNYRQVYDAIAAQLTAHANWDFVETVDFVSGAFTYRSQVWRNNAATSGLIKDFHIAFRMAFTTATGVWATSTTAASSTHSGINVFLFEDYDAITHVASKVATKQSGTSFTLQSDMTHPMTWDPTTALPATAGASIFYGQFGPVNTATTSYRFFIGLTDSALYLASGQFTIRQQTYVGAMDSILAPADDPLALVIFSLDSSYASADTYANGSTTRHPTLTPGAMTWAHGMNTGTHHSATGSFLGSGPEMNVSSLTAAGKVGDPTSLGWSRWLGGPVASRCMVTTGTVGSAGTGSEKGGTRGYLKHMLTAQAVSHNPGDTFLIDGKAYVGLGASVLYGFWDKTA